MKSSQVPNRLSYPPPRELRKMLPLPNPELCHTERLSPSRPPPRPEGLMHPSGFVPSSPVNFGTRANRPLPMPRGRLGPLQHSAQPPGPVYPSRFFPVSQTHMGASYNKPQTAPRFFHHGSPHSRNFPNHSLHPHIRRDQLTQSMVTYSNSGRKNITVQQQELTKVLYSFFSSSPCFGH